MKIYYIDPNSDNAGYKIDWSLWLEGSDILNTSTWTVPAGLTKVTDDKGTDYSQIFLDATSATVGTRYKLVNHVVSLSGEPEDQTITIECKNN